MTEDKKSSISYRFLSALHNRIEEVRPGVIVGSHQLKGYRFKNNVIVGNGVVGAVIAASIKDAPKDMFIPAVASGLSIDESQIISGAYDGLIRFVLLTVSTIDKESESRIDRH